MKNSLFALSLFAAFALLSAEAARETGAWLYLPASGADFSPISGDVSSASFSGHAGNYTVNVWKTDTTIYVNLVGNNTSTAQLASELEYLSTKGALAPACNISHMESMDWADRFICQNDGIWMAFAPSEAMPLPPGSEATRASVGTPSPVPAPLISDVASQRAPEMTGAGASFAKASANAAPPSPPKEGIGTEQMLQLLGAFLAVLVASYLILQSRQPSISDMEGERLLANETRAGIMEELSSADKIPTDISNKLGKSKASVVEHLAALMEAGLVERISTPGKKFVYYRLTQKGRQLLLRMAG